MTNKPAPFGLKRRFHGGSTAHALNEIRFGRECSRGCALFPALLFGALLKALSATHAATIWNGPLIAYTQPAPDPTQTTNQDRLTSRVCLTRAAAAGMFNAVTETSYTHNLSPADTEWALGWLTNYASLSYASWETIGGGHPVLNLIGQPLVVHLITDDIFLSLEFTALGEASSTGFSYFRSTPAVAIPGALAIQAQGGSVVLNWAGSYPLQTATNLDLSNFVDVAGVTNGPYTNAASGARRFFRLRGI